MPDAATDLLAYWFAEDTAAHWFHATPEFDRELHRRYGDTLQRARRGELQHWADTAAGALALVIVLDQFPRNLHRGTAEAFASDAQALAVARGAIERGYDRQVDERQRSFFYMPLMHSESLADQHDCVALFEAQAGTSLNYAVLHRDLIARFGRFPHRNDLLDRTSTDEELAYLSSPDAFRG